jgi:hypothetical protein
MRIASIGVEALSDDFMAVHHEIQEVLTLAKRPFSDLLALVGGSRFPRYYQAVFLAVYDLMFQENLRLSDRPALVKKFDGLADKKSGKLKVAGGGGDWRADGKQTTVDSVKGVIRKCFEPRKGDDDLAKRSYAGDLEEVLKNARVEQQLFECKQGLYSLTGSREFTEPNFTKILATFAAMANMGPGVKGYLAIGVADDSKAAKAVKEADNEVAEVFAGFHIVGIEREAALRKESVHDYWNWILSKIRDAPKLDAELRSSLARDARLIQIHGKFVALFKVAPMTRPALFDETIYEREGSSTMAVKRSDEHRVHSRFVRP